MPDRPHCLKCDRGMWSNGKTKAKTQQWICQDCGGTTTGNAIGRPTDGKVALTPAERSRKYRAKKKAEKLTPAEQSRKYRAKKKAEKLRENPGDAD